MCKKTAAAPLKPIGAVKAGAPTAHQVVVVLGSGRSGTSLCAKLLSRLGIAMEATLQRPNEMNPEGYFEDARLVDINKRLLEKLAPVSGVAPISDVTTSKVGPEMTELRAHLRERTSAAPGIWGFKDPRVSMLLPLYRRAFQDEGIVPKYIFCARSANSVIESLRQTGIKSRERCEQIYFIRSFLALRDCAANCHVLHYENLLENPKIQAKKVWEYLHDNASTFPMTDVECENIVDNNLNRSSLQATPTSNPLAIRIEKLIDSMEGNEFDREYVFRELKSIDAINSGYQVWVDQMVPMIDNLKNKVQKLEREGKAVETGSQKTSELIEKTIKERDDAQDNLSRQKSCAAALGQELSEMQAKTARLNKERNAAIARVRSRDGEFLELRRKFERTQSKLIRLQSAEKKLKAENVKTRDELRHSNNKLNEMKAQLAKMKAEIDRLSGSVRHRVGTLLVDAARRPGWNTLALPWRLVRLRSETGSGEPKE